MVHRGRTTPRATTRAADPTIDATANADVIAPVARPRFSGGNTSPITAMIATAANPPNTPASVRAASIHS